VGIGFFLPVLPLFLRSRGGAPLLVGIVFAAGVVGRAVAQYPAGWLADRWGRRPLLIGSVLVYALIFPLYILPIPVAALVGVRFAHSLVAGAFTPAAMALAADLTGPEARGRTFSRLRASYTVGLLLGPALGGLVAGLRLDYVFGGGAVLCLAAVPLLLRLPAAPAPARPAPVDGQQPIRIGALLWRLLPVIALAAPVTWTYGTFDSIWSLYLASRGASTFVIGLSFATYALPIVLFGGLTAGLADRIGHVRAGTIALVSYGLLASVYPFVASVPLLVLVGLLEGSLSAAGVPALNAETSRLAPPGAQGRTQGAYQLALNVAQVAGAVAGGALYGIRPAYAFLGVSVVCLTGVSASLLIRRAGTAGE
jgi:DHA1 family tetracycline resistance protein-like MFS transporter